jgi:hypothetical protein
MMSIETEKHSVSLMMAGESSKKRLEHLRRRQVILYDGFWHKL